MVPDLLLTANRVLQLFDSGVQRVWLSTIYFTQCIQLSSLLERALIDIP